MLQPENRIILASQSPRRKDLLDQMGLAGKYEVIPSEYEEILDNARSPEDVAQELGYGKALWVAERNPGAWVIGGDTIVTVDGKQLGKAESEKDAREMLKMLAGSCITVTSSAVLVKVTGGRDKSRIIKHSIGSENSYIHFKPFDESAVDEYIKHGAWQDKAGAYGIQSGGHTLAEAVEGNYDTILGFPTHTLVEFLDKIGISASAVELDAPVPVRQQK